MKHFAFWIIAVALLATLVACGPALPPELAAAPTRVVPTATANTPAFAEAELTGNTPADAETQTQAPTEFVTGSYRGQYPVGFTPDGRPYVGTLNAATVIEEYSDYECPFCQRFYAETFEQLLANEIANGQAVMILNDFPLDQIHPQARPAAIAARCAGEAGAEAYFAMHDLLFDNFGSWSIANPNPLFSQYAEQIGVGGAEFDNCLAEARYDGEVQADLLRGQQAGVRGTPAFVINGQVLSGAQPYGVFNQAIARATAGEPIVEEPNLDDIVVDQPEPFIFSSPAAATLGDANAPVVIAEFTDYQCPFCARHSADTMPALIAEYIQQGIVRYELRDLPLDQIHPQARFGANVARCAGEQGAYWQMHDLLYERQGEWSTVSDPAAIAAGYSDELGLDGAAFSACVSSDRYADAIEANFQEAVQIGIGGTPFFFVQGFPVINGAQPFDVFQEVIDLAANDELVSAIMDARRQQVYAEQQQAAQAPAQPTGPVDVPLNGAYALGDPNAPVTIVEYTDYQCPFCRRHYLETFAEIKRNYIDTGDVYYVFKDFPLTQIHPQAIEAAEAARCAGEQERFIEMHGRLFEDQSLWSNRTDALTVFTSIAGDLGIDSATFSECVSSNRFESLVLADLDEGASFGIRGTPGFFINGQPLSGAQPYSVFAGAIDSLLNP